MDSFGAGALICAPETVWGHHDAGCYAERDSGIGVVTGDIGHGQSVRIRTPGLARSVPVTVLRHGNGAMSWTFRLPGRLVKAVRTITVSAQNGKTRLAVRDDFAGPLWRLIKPCRPELARASEGYADGVRTRAERLS